MTAPALHFRVPPGAHAEIMRIASANNVKPSVIARQLIEEALANRAEDITASQFELVDKRLDYIEKRFSAFLVKIARATFRAEFFAENSMLEPAGDDEAGRRIKKYFRDEANKYAREALKAKSKDQMPLAVPVDVDEEL